MNEQDELRHLLLEELRLRKKSREQARSRQQVLAGAWWAIRLIGGWLAVAFTLGYAAFWHRP